MHELLASVRFGENSANVEWNADSTFTTREQLYFTASLDGRAYPKSFNLFLAPHKGMGITSAVNAEFSPYYTAGGENGLTDGIMATMDFRDGRWQGYQVENELVVTIDLGSLAEITSCASNFYQYNNAWIFAPTKVEYFTSEDGEGFKSIGTANPTHSQKEKGKFIEPITVVLPKPIQARFVKMVANSVGPCPDWHDAAGSPSWLFVDEFYVN
jgi:hexosaminidase